MAVAVEPLSHAPSDAQSLSLSRALTHAQLPLQRVLAAPLVLQSGLQRLLSHAAVRARAAHLDMHVP